MPPASHEQQPFPSDGTGEPRFLLRDAADIRGLLIHLVTHWSQPQVEFRITGLHVLHSQRAQDRFVRLAEGCKCLLGEALGATTLVVGAIKVWASMQGWLSLVLVLVATAFAVLIGKAMELAWNRAKLLLVLHGLRRRLHTAEGSPERGPGAMVVAPGPRTLLRPATATASDESGPDNLTPRPLLHDGPRRPPILLRSATDIHRAVRRLAIPWKLPRIEVRFDGLAPLDAQRAQAGIVRFSGACSYLPAAFMAVAVLLTGMLHGVWIGSSEWLYSEREDWWLLKLDWNDVQTPVIAALCAALLGVVLEKIWMRLRLLLVLRGITAGVPAA